MLWIPVAATLALAPSAQHSPENEVSVHATFPFPGWGAALGYQRRLSRHISLGAQLETVVPPRGYLHLPGFEEFVNVSVWLRKVGDGAYLSPMVSLAHNLFYRLPDQSRHVARVGGELGWRFALSRRISVGAGLGAQWGGSVGPQGSICTYDYQCASTRPGAVVRGRVSMGVRW